MPILHASARWQWALQAKCSTIYCLHVILVLLSQRDMIDLLKQ
ncbi:hypothetical protein LCGC14_2698980 [marine sediment metagenome]|uniref:Uncharacterized protein n=1 Tax=marine sediment metagenome TaxID=412755 RepID=A0A0F9BQM8_9ZZZZ